MGGARRCHYAPFVPFRPHSLGCFWMEFGGGLMVNLWFLAGEPGEGVCQEALLEDGVEFRDTVVEDFCGA